MIGQFVKGRIYVFIDAENVFYSQRTLGWKISYEKLMRYFKKECGEETKCFIYKGVDEFNTKQQKFLDMLSIAGYIVRTKTVKKIKDYKSGKEEWKGNLDMELAFEMDDTKDKYDTAVLMSGDSDFSVAIDRIKKAGKWIIVMSTRGHIARELLERAKYVDLRRIREEIALAGNDVVIGNGNLAGKGVYANRDFKKGEVVIKYHLTALTHDEFEKLPESEKMFTHIHQGITYLYSEPERYVNHLDDPNTYQDLTNKCDAALRDIKKGEPITTDAAKDDI